MEVQRFYQKGQKRSYQELGAKASSLDSGVVVSILEIVLDSFMALLLPNACSRSFVTKIFTHQDKKGAPFAYVFFFDFLCLQFLHSTNPATKIFT